MKDQTRKEPAVLAAAERQMKAWAASGEPENPQLESRGLQEFDREVQPYVSVSREAGACGGEIADMVGDILGCDVLDKKLLNLVAERFNVSPMMLELVDETRSNWVYEVLGTWMDRKVIPHMRYVTMLSRVLLAATHCASVVIVGRGAQFLLPREKGLNVRVIAPEKLRLDRFAKRSDLSLDEAQYQMQEMEQGRREFVERFFKSNADDAHLYDIVINTERIAPEDAAEQIATAFRRRFPKLPAVPMPHLNVDSISAARAKS